MTSCKTLIIGGGMAAARLAECLGARDPDMSVVIAGDESCLGYNRVRLPDYVAGTCTFEQMQETVCTSSLSLLPRTIIDAVDVGARVAFADKQRIHFEQLVFATGSTAPVPSIPGTHRQGVMPLRSLADADQLRDQLSHAKRAVVLGGGLLGLETADALARRGLDVHVVHRGHALMNRQLDQHASELLANHLISRGIEITTAASITEIRGDKAVNAVTLSNGAELNTDLLILATGTTPRMEIAQAAGVACEDGILVDRSLKTNTAGVSALGECANMCGQRAGLVAMVNRQAEVLADNLCGGSARMEEFVPNTHLKLEHLAIFSAGQTFPEDESEDLVIRDPANGIYRRLLFRGNTLIGAVLLGRTNGATRIVEQINSTLDSVTCERLAFGY